MKLQINKQSILTLWLLLLLAQAQQQCQVDSECPQLHICNKQKLQCEHKSIIPPTTLEIIGCLLILLLVGLANASGLGGGVLMVPLLLIFFKYESRTSINISFFLVFGGSLANFVVVLWNRNPNTGKSLIDFNLASICLPSLLAGTVLGLFLNIISPEVGVITTFALLVLNTIYKSVLKYQQERIKENKLAQNSTLLPEQTSQNSLIQQQQQQQQQNTLTHQLFISDTQKINIILPENNTVNLNGEAKQILKEEKRLIPIKKLIPSILLLKFLILVKLLAGDTKRKSIIDIQLCSIYYWLLIASQIILIIGVFYIVAKKVLKINEIKEKYQLIQPEDFIISKQILNKLFINSLFGGVLAGYLGLGGGIILNPLFLTLGVDSQVASATSGFTVLFTSFIAVAQSIIKGDLKIIDQLFFFILALISSFIISSGLVYIVRKTNKKSLTILVLVLVLGLFLVFLPYYAYNQINNHSEKMFTFSNPCSCTSTN